jgi:hypothetical protein
MLVGPTGGGKTVARNILSRALTLLPIYTDKERNKEKNPLNIVCYFYTFIFFNLNDYFKRNQLLY